MKTAAKPSMMRARLQALIATALVGFALAALAGTCSPSAPRSWSPARWSVPTIPEARTEGNRAPRGYHGARMAAPHHEPRSRSGVALGAVLASALAFAADRSRAVRCGSIA